MITQFLSLFTVTVSHTYYSTGCRDFDFVLPADTVKILRDRKLIARVHDGKLYVLFEADETGTARVSASGANIRIGLKLLNSFFTNFTGLGFDINVTTPLYRNSADPAVLGEAEETTLTGRMLSHELTISVRPVTVILKSPAGVVFQTETITTANNRSAVSYDLSGHDAGVYSIEEVYPEDTRTTIYYSDPELQHLGVFGILEVKIGNSFYATAPEFEIPFQAKKETLKYYIVTKNYTESEFNHLSVEDGEHLVSFDKVPSSSFGAGDISPAMLGGNDVKVVLFKSHTVVARRETARKKIQLKKNGDIILTHLPQPGSDQVDGNVIVRISKS